MSRTIRIPAGLRTLDFLATASRSQTYMIEADERYRLYDVAVQQIDVKTLSAILQNQPPYLVRGIWDGSIILPRIKNEIHLESSIWGSNIALHNVSDPELYSGNVGYTHFARDISILFFKEVAFKGSPLAEHRGGAPNFVSGWKKALYLLQLCENREFLSQCAGEEGLDLFAEHYFSGNTRRAWSFAINFLSREMFESLDWRTTMTKGVRGKIEAEHANIYKNLLECAKRLHRRRPRIGVEPFLSGILARADEWTARVAEIKRSKPLKHFGVVRKRLVRWGVDTTELDDIIAKHGLGHRELSELYAELLMRAEEDGQDADMLSRIAVEHGVLKRPLYMAFTHSRRLPLLAPFREYGISASKLDRAITENSVPSVAQKIICWGSMPDPKGDLMGYLGMPVGDRKGYQDYLSKKFDEPEYKGKMFTRAKGLLRQNVAMWVKRQIEADKRKKLAPKKKIVAQEGRAPSREEPTINVSEVTPLDVFHKLSSEDGIPDSTLDRMDDLLEAADEVDGPLTSIQIRNLRRPFDKHFGEDVVDAALEDAGVELD